MSQSIGSIINQLVKGSSLMLCISGPVPGLFFKILIVTVAVAARHQMRDVSKAKHGCHHTQQRSYAVVSLTNLQEVLPVAASKSAAE